MERDILFRELNALGLPSNGAMAFFEPRNFFMPEPNALELRRRYASILDTAAKSGNNYYLTDSIFYGLHPELGGRDLTSADSALIREWNKIKESHKRKNTADYLTDIVFYGLHPELGGRELRRSETDLIQEWKDIKAQVVLNQTTGTKIEEREFKFELQTENIIWRTDGRRRSKLPRKFGPQEFVHKRQKGKPAQDGKEGTAMELQSEEGGFVEFETPKWFRSWCELKERIQEATDMARTINRLPGTTSASGVKTVKFPYDIEHLRRTSKFDTGLSSKEYLEVEILDPTWTAKIQVSEAIELTQYESLLREHAGSWADIPINAARKILNTANTARLPLSELVNLLSFLQIIAFYIKCGQEASLINKEDTNKRYPAKFAFILMCRTSFSSIFQALLNSKEQSLFRQIVDNQLIIKEFGLTDRSQFFIDGHGTSRTRPTVAKWLNSIVQPIKGKDLLSYSPTSARADGFNGSQAMGRFDVKNRTDKVRFEARGSVSYGNSNAEMVYYASDWVNFAEAVFKSAFKKRNTGTEADLKYNPSKCP